MSNRFKEQFPGDKRLDSISSKFFVVMGDEKPFGEIKESNAEGAIGFPSRFIFNSYVETEDEIGKRLERAVVLSFAEAVSGTYREDDRYRFIDYIHLPSNKYIFRIIYDKEDEIWMVKKATREGELIATLYNESLDELMKHLLLSGYN